MRKFVDKTIEAVTVGGWNSAKFKPGEILFSYKKYIVGIEITANIRAAFSGEY